MKTGLKKGQYRDIGLDYWLLATFCDPIGARLADGHYSRRKPGSPQFLPPGDRIALISHDGQAVFGWWRPHPASGIKSMNGLDGWTCSIFRNADSGYLSSAMVLDAERALVEFGCGCGPDGLLTYVEDSKVLSENPGFCFKLAGYVTHPTKRRSADGKKSLLWKPFAAAGTAPMNKTIRRYLARKHRTTASARATVTP